VIARGLRGSGPGSINPLLLIGLVLLLYAFLSGTLVSPVQRAAQDPIGFIGFVIAILLGITVHEFMHAYAATRLGDDTARLLGRLSLNPMAHLDPFGTLLIVLAGFGYGTNHASARHSA
jgi:Zn-dependent protease